MHHRGLLMFGAALVAGMWLAWAFARMRKRAAGRRAVARGKKGELRAERMLERQGYQIVARQAGGSYRLALDGAAHETTVRADLIVSRNGRTMVAEVKTGANVARIEHEATRRQLLEYQLAFGLDSVLLVDGESGEVREVRFPLPSRGGSLFARLLGLGCAAALGALTALYLSRAK